MLWLHGAESTAKHRVGAQPLPAILRGRGELRPVVWDKMSDLSIKCTQASVSDQSEGWVLRLHFDMVLCKDRLNEFSPSLSSPPVFPGNVQTRGIDAYTHPDTVKFPRSAKLNQENHGRGPHLGYSNVQVDDGNARATTAKPTAALRQIQRLSLTKTAAKNQVSGDSIAKTPIEMFLLCPK